MRMPLMILSAGLLAASTQASANDTKDVVEFLSDPVVLYQDDAGDQVAERIPRSAIALPVRVIGEAGDYLQLRLEDRPLWVSMLKVRLDRPAAHCARHRQADQMATSRAIGEGCAK